jgi:hypothetical protein
VAGSVVFRARRLKATHPSWWLNSRPKDKNKLDRCNTISRATPTIFLNHSWCRDRMTNTREPTAVRTLIYSGQSPKCALRTEVSHTSLRGTIWWTCMVQELKISREMEEEDPDRRWGMIHLQIWE